MSSVNTVLVLLGVCLVTVSVDALRCYNCNDLSCRDNPQASIAMDCSMFPFENPVCVSNGQTNAEGVVTTFARTCFDPDMCMEGCVSMGEGAKTCLSCCSDDLCNTDRLGGLDGTHGGDDTPQGGNTDDDTLKCYTCQGENCRTDMDTSLQMDCSFMNLFNDPVCAVTGQAGPDGEISMFARSCTDRSMCMMNGCMQVGGNKTCMSCCETSLCNTDVLEGLGGLDDGGDVVTPAIGDVTPAGGDVTAKSGDVTAKSDDVTAKSDDVTDGSDDVTQSGKTITVKSGGAMAVYRLHVLFTCILLICISIM